MKRVLLATTALCMGAGTAFAQDAMMDMGPSITLSGEAEMGVAASKDNSVRFHTDVNITFTASGTTDTGVTFGTAIGLDDIENAAGRDTTDDVDDHGGIAVHMSQPDGFGTLTLGDTDGGFDWAMDEVGSGGIRSDSEHAAWSGNAGLDGKHDGQVLRWDRAIGSGFSMGASVELDDHGDNEDSYDPIIGLGGKFSMPMGAGSLALGGGFQSGSFDHVIRAGDRVADPDKAGATVRPAIWRVGTGIGSKATGGEVDGAMVGGSAKMDFGGDMGGLSVTLNASMGEFDGSQTGTGTDPITMTADVEQTHLGLGLGYKIGAVSLGVNVGSHVTESMVDEDNATDNNTTKLEETVTGVGFDVGYDLGGGATLMFGFGSSETETDYTYGSASSWTVTRPTGVTTGTRDNWHDGSIDTNQWSLGVQFSF